MSKRDRGKKRSADTGRKQLLTALVVVTAAVGGWAVWSSTQTPGATLHRVVLIRDGQTSVPPLVASRLCGASSACQNGAGGIDVGVLIAGTAPSTPTDGVVTTDENCMPDRYGLSHCLNQVRLANGGVITLRHDHNMQVYPCLEPGEKVRVESAIPSWGT